MTEFPTDVRRSIPPIRVRTIVRDPKVTPIITYSVTGGEIIGSGSRVLWNVLHLPSRREHSITVTVSNAERTITESVSRSVRVDGRCDEVCSCSDGRVVADPAVGIRETVRFTTEFRPPVGKPVKYDWTVEGGKILEGQGTSSIRVVPEASMIGKKMKATVQIDCPEMCSKCPRSFSASVPVLESTLFTLNTDRIDLPCNGEKLREDAMLVRIAGRGGLEFGANFGDINRSPDGYIWDLTNAAPGIYSVRGRDAGSGDELRRTLVVSNDHCPVCPEPNLIVSSETIRIGRQIMLKPTIDAGKAEEFRLEWTAVGGTLLNSAGFDDAYLELDPKSEADEILVKLTLTGKYPNESCKRVIEKRIRILR